MSEKHAALGEFAALDPERPWIERMGDWNERFPDWRYSDVRNFARDARHALERVRGAQQDAKSKGTTCQVCHRAIRPEDGPVCVLCREKGGPIGYHRSFSLVW